MGEEQLLNSYVLTTLVSGVGVGNFGRLFVGGNVTLQSNPTLRVEMIEGFLPEDNDLFSFLLFTGTFTGGFTIMPINDGGIYTWSLDFSDPGWVKILAEI